MIYFDVPQRSPDWYNLRRGIATASCFNQIMTPKKLEMSKSADGYADMLIAELISGRNLEKFKPSYWMEHGAQYEAEAMKMYELETGYVLGRGGFMTDDEMTYGCSPDVRVFDKDGNVVGAAEIKCPAPDTHVSNLLRDEVDPDNILQVQGQLFVNPEFQFIDWYSYNPDMAPARIRTTRDQDIQDALAEHLFTFEKIMREKIARLAAKGVKVVRAAERPKPAQGSGIEDFLMAG